MRNWGARVHETSLSGFGAIILENRYLRLTVLVDKGADLAELNYKPHDLDFVWWTADGLPPATTPVGGDAAAAFFSSYQGGWQEIFPNGGAPCRHRGAPLAQHGDLAAQPWDYTILKDSAEAVAVTFTARSRCLPARMCKTLDLADGQAGFGVDARLTNESDVAIEAMWGRHIAFGQPFLRPGCRLRLPAGVRVLTHPEAINPPRRRVAPRDNPYTWPTVCGPTGEDVDLSILPTAGTASEMLYLTGFTDGWYEVIDPSIGRGLRVSWDAQVLPYLWFWQEFGDTAGYPWYGRHYNIGLEPFSSYPTSGLADASRNNTALTLAPRETRKLVMHVQVLDAASPSVSSGDAQ